MDAQTEQTQADSLLSALEASGLSEFYWPLKSQLGVQTAEQVRSASDTELADVGLDAAARRRLRKCVERRHPRSLVGRLRRTVAARVGGGGATGERAPPPPPPPQQQHIIGETDVTLCKQLGAGEFGCVWQGVWRAADQQRQVAVKCVSAERMRANPLDFIQEAAILHRVHHAHVVRLFGVVLTTCSVQLVTELAPLRSLLECLREGAARSSFPVLRLCDFAEQIASGMTYLEANHLIHRDLAARNILVFSSDLVKISDFGLSRALGAGEEYYKANFSVNLKLPIAWCAPECINYLKFTAASDMWSFGVTLWEMFTGGFQPWAGMTGQQILSAIDVPNCQRLDQPDACPREYYSLMLQCWAHEPANRPKFSDVCTILPEIRPDRVQAITANLDGQTDHLQYDSGLLITVLDKQPKEYPDGYYWKGALESGRTGLFLPCNTVAYLPVQYPSLPPNFTFSSSLAPPPETKRGGGQKRAVSPKITGSCISEPQGAVRHVAHVGIDGSSFGQVAPMGKSHLPRQVVPPMQNGQINEMNDGDSAESSRQVPDAASKRPRPPPVPPAENIPDLDAAVFLNSGMSLLDEVFDALAEDEGGCESRAVHPTDTSERTRLLSGGGGGGGEARKAACAAKPEAFVRPVSLADARLLDDMTSTAQRMSAKVLTRDADRRRHAVEQAAADSDDAAKKGSPRAIDRVFRTLKLSRSRSNESSENGSEGGAPRCFTDVLDSRSDLLGQRWTPDAEDAYKSLVDCRRSLAAQPDTNGAADDAASDEDSSPLRRLRQDSAQIARSFRPGSGGRGKRFALPDVTCRVPQPVPPKPQPAPRAIDTAPLTRAADESDILPPAAALDFTFEDVDKYSLLDFVMSALEKQQSPTTTAPPLAPTREDKSAAVWAAVESQEDDFVNV